jgi:hypothetical protein
MKTLGAHLWTGKSEMQDMQSSQCDSLAGSCIVRLDRIHLALHSIFDQLLAPPMD